MGRMCILLVLTALCSLVVTKTSRVRVDPLPHHGRCEPISIPLCQQIEYNQTIFPNLLNHANQRDAAAAMDQFTPLIRVNCSPDLKIFLCLVFAPVCVSEFDKPILPCRHLCESAKQGCNELMENFGFSWPDYLDCSKYPGADGYRICVSTVGVENATTINCSGNHQNCPIKKQKTEEKKTRYLTQPYATAVSTAPPVQSTIAVPAMPLPKPVSSNLTFKAEKIANIIINAIVKSVITLGNE